MIMRMITMTEEKVQNVDLAPICEMLDQITNDRTVPRNIRSIAEESKNALEGNGANELKISTAISNLDEVINDPNMPMYTRTQIWNIVSMLEQIRTEL